MSKGKQTKRKKDATMKTTTIIAKANNETVIITDNTLTLNQAVILAKQEMVNDRSIMSVIVSCGRKSVEYVQSLNAITCLWEIRKL